MQTEELVQLARAAIEREIAGVSTWLEQQLDDRLVQAARLMLACQGHVLVTGVGTSRHVAARFAHLLTCCGTPALYIHPGDSQHGLAGAVTARDLLVAISKGGQTAEVNYLAGMAQKRGARLIALTEEPGSPLGRLSDVVLCVQAPPDADPYGMIATGSSLLNAAVCDALCVVLLELRGYSREAFGETHPGGAVGARLAAEKAPPAEDETRFAVPPA